MVFLHKLWPGKRGKLLRYADLICLELKPLHASGHLHAVSKQKNNKNVCIIWQLKKIECRYFLFLIVVVNKQ